jgi:hypothetical protein
MTANRVHSISGTSSLLGGGQNIDISAVTCTAVNLDFGIVAQAKAAAANDLSVKTVGQAFQQAGTAGTFIGPVVPGTRSPFASYHADGTKIDAALATVMNSYGAAGKLTIPQAASPSEVHTWWSSLTSQDQQALIAAEPSDPNNWDGPLARKFRGDVWPKAKADLDKMKASLDQLQQSVQKILTNISHAGGA